MTQEIQRKFLLTAAPEWIRSRPGRRIEQGFLVRTRREISVGDGLEAEIDIYEGDFEGLIVAMIGFGSRHEAREFSPPGWLGKEVTGDKLFSSRDVGTEKPSRRNGDGAKAEPYRLDHVEGMGDGIRRIARGRANSAIAGLFDSPEEDRAEAIHSARKDMKKLRAVLRLVREDVGEEVYGTENSRYRVAGRLLSRSRDSEAKLATLATLADRFGERAPAMPVHAWSEALVVERDEIAGEGGEGEQAAQIALVITALEAGREEVANWPLAGDSWALIEPGLLHSHRQGRRQLRRMSAQPNIEQVHELRKRVKDFWYQLRIVREAWPELLGATAGQAHELSDLLGDHHDLTVLGADLGLRPEIGQQVELMALMDGRQDELIADALGLGARLYAERPKAFQRRLRAYGHAWRG